MIHEFKIACPHCRQHIAFPETDMGQVIPCPDCGLSVCLTVPGYPIPFTPQSKGFAPDSSGMAKVQSAEKIPDAGSSNSDVGGCLFFVVFVGVVLCVIGIFFWWPAIFGAIFCGILFMGLGAAANGIQQWQCSSCGVLVPADAKICPACQCVFKNQTP